MKRVLLCLALLPLISFCLEKEESKKSPEAEAAEKAARVAEMTKVFQSSVVTVRFRMKVQPDGSSPEASLNYRCPCCGNGSRHVENSIEKDMPCEIAGFVLASNRVLVQDLALRPQWFERLEVCKGGTGIPARVVARFPQEHALLLETEQALAGVVPLAFTGDATNKPSLFGLVTEPDGRVQAGLRNVNRDFRYWPATGEALCSAVPNTIVVDASNRAVSVQMRMSRSLADVVPKPPSQWSSEPADALEARVSALEARLRKGILPIYLHIDEEKKESRSRFRFVMDDDDPKASGDVDTVGYVLAGGDVLVPLNLDSGKIASLDKMEATLPDNSRCSLEFVGAFAEYGYFLLRFVDGKIPDAVQPIVCSQANADALIFASAYRARPKNRNGEVKIDLAPREITGFKRVRSGLVVPDCMTEESGTVLFSSAGEILALGGVVRMVGDSWRARTAVSGTELARLVNVRDFDPEFAVRKGKDRIRVAWIGVETQAMTKELARQKKAQGFLSREDGTGALVSKVYPQTPADKAGVKEGDVLLWVRKASGQRHERLGTREGSGLGMDLDSLFESMPVSFFDRYGATPWPQVESGVNETFTKMGIGTKVVLAWVSDGVRREAELILEQAPVHYRTAKRIRNRTLGIVAADLTFEVRAYLKLAADAPGVVITKMKDGSPAAVAGLRPMEVITEVNGQPVSSAIRFAEMIKGQKELSFAVRRLNATRIVRIQLKEQSDGEGK